MENIQPYLDSIKSFVTNYFSQFKQYPLWKQTLISGAAITGSTMVYTVGSYYYCKLRYSSMPRIYTTVTGDIEKSKGVIVFIHGFPDFEYLWEKQVAFFTEKNYSCITLEIPNFNIDRIQNPWGYPIRTILTAMANTLKQLLKNRECILFCHDWGCMFGQLLYLNHKDDFTVNKLVLLDVADGPDVDKNGRLKDPKLAAKYVYQLHCAAAYLSPSWFGTWYLRRYFNNSFKLDSSSESVAAASDWPLWAKERRDKKAYFTSLSAYLYYYAITDGIFGDVKKRLNEFDGIPILFVDANAGKDPLVFYSTKYKAFLDERDYCKFVEFNDCYHWIMYQNPDKLNETAYQFIQQ